MIVERDVTTLPALYQRYSEDLRRAREAQRELYERCGYSPWQRFPPYRWLRTALRRIGIDWERTRYMNPKLDDMEAELTYLRIRDRRPATVVEISPFRAWSTTWILRALEDNGEGALVSFDLVEDSRRFVPAELADRWTLIVGDVRDRTSDMPEPIDYLFIDSDHRRTFAEWYLAELIPRLAPGAAVSVHDVFHGRGPGRGSGEARIVLDWLDRWRIRWVTPSRFGPGSFHDEVRAHRLNLGLGPRIHHGDHNSMILFDVPEGPGARSRRLAD